MIREGERVAVLSFGPIGNYVLEAARALEEEGIQIGHFDMRFAKPLDTALIDEVLDSYESIITIEDGTRLGGFGSAVAEYVAILYRDDALIGIQHFKIGRAHV